MNKLPETVLKELKQWGCSVDEARDRLLEDDELYIRFLQKVIDDKDFTKLLPMLKNREYQPAFELSHMLRGVTANLGLTPLYESLSSLVEKLRVGNYADCLEEFDKISAGYLRLAQILKTDL